LTINLETTEVKVEVQVRVYFSTLAFALTFNDDAIIPSSIFNCQRTSKRSKKLFQTGW
jgi:hypothetical protein